MALTKKIMTLKVLRQIHTSAIRFDLMMNDPLDHATGIEKRELLAIASGNLDPFDMQPLKRGEGSKEKPNLVPSAFQERLVGCICDEESCSISYMWLFKDEMKRCSCGFWFKLVNKAPV